jgi:hypothetical protein
MNRPLEATDATRRKFLLTTGGCALLVPLAALTGCGKKPAPATSEPAAGSNPPQEPAAPPPATEMPPETAPDESAASRAPAAGAETLVKIEETDAQARALGYRHDHTKVDTKRYPAKAAPQNANARCANCALYRDVGQADWGGCAVLPGKLVAANGWCSAYVAKA